MPLPPYLQPNSNGSRIYNSPGGDNVVHNINDRFGYMQPDAPGTRIVNPFNAGNAPDVGPAFGTDWLRRVIDSIDDGKILGNGGGKDPAAGGGPGGPRAADYSGAAQQNQQDLIEQMLAAAGVGSSSSGSSGPSLDDVLAPYIQARQSANQSYDAAVPVIHDAFNDLLADLNSGQRGANREARQDNRAAGRDVRRGLQDNAGQGRSAQNDLAAAAGGAQDVAGSLAAQLSGAVQGVAADQRASAQDDRQLSNRISQVGREETRATREDTRLAKGNALGTAQNNLDSILNAIGLEEAGARSAWESAQAESASASAGAAEGVGLELQNTINTATADNAQSALAETLAAGQPWQKALDLVRAAAPSLSSGMNQYGVPIDPLLVIKMIRQLGPAAQSNTDAQVRNSAQQSQAASSLPPELLQQLNF